MNDSTGRGTAQAVRRPDVTCIGGARQQTKVDVRGIIRSVDVMSLGGIPTFRCTLADDSGEIDLLFLGRAVVAGLEPGRRCRAAGMAAARDHRAVLWNPRYWLEPTEPAGPVGPAEAADRASRSPAGRAPRGPSAGQMTGRVLIVDDDTAIRRVMRINLAARGYQVDLAATGADAIDLAQLGPDLVILDIGLPDINGISAIGAIRDRCNARIIVISGREPGTARAAALAAGANDYLPKPFAIDTLLARIQP